MKKLFCLVSVLLLLLALFVACGDDASTSTTSTTPKDITTTVPQTTKEPVGEETTAKKPLDTTAKPDITTTVKTPEGTTAPIATTAKTPEPSQPEAICLNDVAGAHAYVYAFEKPTEFGGPVGLIYFFQDNTTDHHTAIQEGIQMGDLYAVVKIDGKAYRIDEYANGAPYFRFNVETPGAILQAGVAYEIVVEIYDATGLMYYTKPETKTTAFSTANAPEREGQNVTLPSGLGDAKVNTDSIVTDGITPWGDGAALNLFDSNVAATKIGGNTTGTVTITFSLTKATTVTYYTFYTGGDTAQSPDRNPESWTLYGKVNEEWVALSEIKSTATASTGLGATNASPYSYQVTNPKECTEYKLVLVTGNAFQMNELLLHYALAEGEDPDAALDNRSDYLSVGTMKTVTKNNTRFQLIEHVPTAVEVTTHANGNEIAILTFKFKSDGDPFKSGTNGVQYTSIEELYVNGVKATVTNYTTEAHWIIYITFDPSLLKTGENEFIFSLSSQNDPSDFCSDKDGYFAVTRVTLAE
ncbi:MAG: hypothetical protein IJW46_06935 [Clostridia bacterium]|nr:hypothetical protein [Clostridia bacterium]